MRLLCGICRRRQLRLPSGICSRLPPRQPMRPPTLHSRRCNHRRHLCPAQGRPRRPAFRYIRSGFRPPRRHYYRTWSRPATLPRPGLAALNQRPRAATSKSPWLRAVPSHKPPPLEGRPAGSVAPRLLWVAIADPQPPQTAVAFTSEPPWHGLTKQKMDFRESVSCSMTRRRKASLLHNCSEVTCQYQKSTPTPHLFLNLDTA